MNDNEEDKSFFKLGKNYVIESVTSWIYVGKLVSIDGPHTVTLEDCSWVSSTGRLERFMRTGRADGMEVEPIGIRMIHWATISPWPFECFNEVIE